MFFQLILDPSPGQEISSVPGTPTFFIVAVVIAVLILIVFAAVRVLRSSSKEGDWGAFNREKMTKSWKEIEGLATQGPMTRKLAVIEADKLVDHALKTVGYPGETMSERMKVAEYKHPKIREMWQAHKWRNQLVHEAHFDLSERQTKEALRAFEAVLRSLHALV